jgi:hypothetical protein
VDQVVAHLGGDWVSVFAAHVLQISFGVPSGEVRTGSGGILTAGERDEEAIGER